MSFEKLLSTAEGREQFYSDEFYSGMTANDDEAPPLMTPLVSQRERFVEHDVHVMCGRVM